MHPTLLIFLGGGTGAVARHLMSAAVKHQTEGKIFPYSTLCVNLLGALLIGMLAEILAVRLSLPETARYFLVTGFLGGFTTFSAFSLESALLIERGDYLTCAVYVAASVLGTIALVFAGMWGMRGIL